jgi:hypothetical protein
MKLKTWVPVFKTGEWTAKNGSSFKADESVIDKILESTKEFSTPHIPFTELHPVNNLPIWGYFEKSDIRKTQIGNDFMIEVKPKEFAKGFEDEMKSKSRKEVSIRIMPDMSIGHVGFVPKGAVKGMPAPFAEFAEFSAEVKDEGIDLTFQTKDFEDTNWKFQILGRILGKLRDKMVEKDGAEAVDEIMSQSDLTYLTDPDDELRDVKSKVIYNNPIKQFEEVEMTPEQEKKLKDFEALQAKILEFEQSTQAKDAELAKALADLKAFKDGRLTASCLEFEAKVEKKFEPKYKGLMSAVMKALKSQESTVFEFSESDEKKPLPDVFAEFIESLEDILPDGQRVIAGQPAIKGKIAAQDAAIKEFQDANDCDYGTALKAVSKQKPELFQ